MFQISSESVEKRTYIIRVEGEGEGEGEGEEDNSAQKRKPEYLVVCLS